MTIEIITAETDGIDFETLEGTDNDACVDGTATIKIDGSEFQINFCVVTTNILTGEPLREYTRVSVWVIGEDGDGCVDTEDTRPEILDNRDAIEEALYRNPNVRAAVREVEWARDQILEMGED
jgi:hypothetical protein